MTETTTFYLESEIIDYLDDLANEYGISRSMALRRLLMICRATPTLRLFP